MNVADGGATEATNIEFANADDEDDDNDDGGGIDEDADADEDELLVDDDDSAFPSCFSAWHAIHAWSLTYRFAKGRKASDSQLYA